MKVLFISLEFSAAAFSGNGINAQSQVRALSSLGHQVLVIAGCPAGHSLPPVLHGAAGLHHVSLPTWGRIDRGCSWREFADGCIPLRSAVQGFSPDVALGVDWTGMEAVKTATAGLSVPCVLMSYRIFLRSSQAKDAEFYKTVEGTAFRGAALAVVLCPSDAQFAVDNLYPSGPVAQRPQVLLPCLRSDLAALPVPEDAAQSPDEAGFSARQHLTCCVRLSPEKEPERFVDFVEALQAQGVLQELQVTPLLVSATSTPYAQALKARLRAAVPPARLEERFLGADELATIYRGTLLNIHPCSSDAFGMTVCEAAAFGAPSVVNHGDAVGATELLQPSRGEALQLDFGQPADQLALQIGHLLADRRLLAGVGRAAAGRARSWSEEGLSNLQLVTTVQTLVLENLALDSIPRAVFQLRALTCLSLQSNNLTDLQAPATLLANLIELSWTHNPVRGVPHELTSCASLERLHMTS